MRFRKKPVVIRAVHFGSLSPASLIAGKRHFEDFEIKQDEKGYYLTIPTLEGDMRCDLGDWIITGVKGERYPCKPDIFEATYERVGED